MAISEKSKQSIWVAAFAFLTALVTNIDRVTNSVSHIFQSSEDEHQIIGEWNAVFKELTEEGEQISVETLTLRMEESKIKGTIKTYDGKARKWDAYVDVYSDDTHVVIRYHGSTTVFNYGAIVLTKVDKDYQVYSGYWVGYDTTIHSVVAYPYVMSKESASKLKKDFAAHLSKSIK